MVQDVLPLLMFKNTISCKEDSLLYSHRIDPVVLLLFNFIYNDCIKKCYLFSTIFLQIEDFNLRRKKMKPYENKTKQRTLRCHKMILHLYGYVLYYQKSNIKAKHGIQVHSPPSRNTHLNKSTPGETFQFSL